jgi:hypothetical protein
MMSAQAATLRIPFQAFRAPWLGEPDVDIHQINEQVVRGHPDHADAKAGDGEAAVRLVDDTINPLVVETLRQRQSLEQCILLPVVAEESEGANAIPLALAQRLSLALGWEMEAGVIQSNVAARTRKDGYYRLAIQPVFDGAVDVRQPFLLVDDFVGQGDTLANLRGHVMGLGGRVAGFTSLAGKAVSGRLALRPETLGELRRIHGQDLEGWWRQVFGFDFERLTESEARYLVIRTDAERVRAEVTARIREQPDQVR